MTKCHSPDIDQHLQLRVASALVTAACADRDEPPGQAAARLADGDRDELETAIDTASTVDPSLASMRLASGSLIWYRIALQCYADIAVNIGVGIGGLDSIEEYIQRQSPAVEEEAMARLGEHASDCTPSLSADPADDAGRCRAIADDAERLASCAEYIAIGQPPREAAEISLLWLLLRGPLPAGTLRRALHHYADRIG